MEYTQAGRVPVDPERSCHTAGQQFVDVSLPAEFFVDLATVNGEPPPAPEKEGPSKVEIVHTVIL